ncbi:MAG: hypothetical protein ACRCSY_08770 [Cetobacterium sp.]
MIGLIAVSVGFDKTPLSIDMEIARFVNRKIERGNLNIFCYSNKSINHYLTDVIQTLYKVDNSDKMDHIISANINATAFSLSTILKNKEFLYEIDLSKNIVHEIKMTLKKIKEFLKENRSNYTFYLKIKKGE